MATARDADEEAGLKDSEANDGPSLHVRRGQSMARHTNSCKNIQTTLKLPKDREELINTRVQLVQLYEDVEKRHDNVMSHVAHTDDVQKGNEWLAALTENHKHFYFKFPP